MAVAAEAEKRRVAQREQAGLAQQHVERQGEDGHHAHLAEHRHDEAGVARMLEVVEQPGQTTEISSAASHGQ